MTLRTQEERETLAAAAAIKRRESKERRKANKEAARKHVEAWAKSSMPNRKNVRERNNAFMAFVRRHPCCVCGGYPVDAAHTRFANLKVGRANPGMGKKPSDRFATPLCRTDHTAQHARGNEAAWWAEQGLDPDEISARLFSAFLAGSEPLALETLRHGTARNASARGRDPLASAEPQNDIRRPFPKRKADA